MRMILWESALLGLLGGILGVLLGAVGVNVMETMPAIHGLLEPDLSVGLFVISIVISIVIAVGVVSGLYPAWRSSRLTPGPAMQA
jgi:putative ABC transport system permease protein